LSPRQIELRIQLLADVAAAEDDDGDERSSTSESSVNNYDCFDAQYVAVSVIGGVL